jgi:iron complex outermembrane receptor protein
MKNLYFWLSTAGASLGALASTTAIAASAQGESNLVKALAGETIGGYSAEDARGVSPLDAGGQRIEGLPFDEKAPVGPHLMSAASLRIGPAAQGVMTPAPSGIVDYRLRDPGDELSLNVAAKTNSWRGASVEADLETPLRRDLSVSLGFGDYRDVNADRTYADYNQLAAVARWTPMANVVLRPFVERDYIHSNPASPVYLTATGAPPAVLPHHYTGPSWDQNRSDGLNAGVIVDASFGGVWNLKASLFRSELTSRSSFAQLYLSLNANGRADRQIYADPPMAFESTSAGLRLERTFSAFGLQQRLILVGRGKLGHDRYGGSSGYDFGVSNIFRPPALAAPTFLRFPQSYERVSQWSAGLAYGLQWADRVELSAALLRTDYHRRVADPGLPLSELDKSPTTGDIAMAVRLTPAATFYASHVEGFEAATRPPDSALNRATLSADVQARVSDAGLRYVFNDQLKMLAGWFELAKPYDGVDKNRFFHNLGDMTDRGLEASLTYRPARNLKFEAAAAVQDMKLAGPTVTTGLSGPHPAGTYKGRAEAKLEFAPHHLSGWAFSAKAAWKDRVYASVDDRYRLPARLTLDLGARHAFEIAGHAMEAQLQIANVGDTSGLVVVAPGAYRRADDRLISLSLAAGF